METLEQEINFTREAFTHPVNMGFLFLAALSAFFLNDAGQAANLIFTIAIGLELVYLGIIPRMPHYQKKMRLKKLHQRNQAVEERLLFRRLNTGSQRKFLVLKHLANRIKENFDKLPYSSQGLLDNIRKKVEQLLSNYLNLLELHQRYASYMDSSMEENVKQEIKKEREFIQRHNSDRLKATKKRRIAILEKRLNKFSKARENSMICETHLVTIEDAIRYIYEESITMNDPKEIGFKLDNLLSEVEETSQIINELDISPLLDEELEELNLNNPEFSDDMTSTTDKTDTTTGKKRINN